MPLGIIRKGRTPVSVRGHSGALYQHTHRLRCGRAGRGAGNGQLRRPLFGDVCGSRHHCQSSGVAMLLLLHSQPVALLASTLNDGLLLAR